MFNAPGFRSLTQFHSRVFGIRNARNEQDHLQYSRLVILGCSLSISLMIMNVNVALNLFYS